ncbi:MBL fold metallo-hydrolase [Paenibacillus mendelii]|uniref:MBL fold metallo-hydrolase n=1 Tax=Paenibacillus mendelii TaxID=206163 RepID=A0ABV6JG01_9BACL|nr:MBL fold metallo-hydrolase [Paenibacillus mendelii]
MTNQKQVELTLHATGYCTHPEWITMRGGSVRSIRIPAGFARIVHPEHGTILFDTGYAARFFDAASRFPYSIYRRVTPVVHDPSEGAAMLLKRQFNLDAGEVNLIILSHFHADHVAGLCDFPNARFIYLPEAYEAVRGLRGLAAVRAGFLPDLMPEDFGFRSSPVPPSARVPLPEGWPFPDDGYDLLGDGSLIGVDVSGHATGQMGLLLSTAEHEYFLCADAAWSGQAIRENRPPHPLAGLIMPDRRQYLQTFTRLRLLAERFPQLRIIPSHCGEVWRMYIQRNERL